LYEYEIAWGNKGNDEMHRYMIRIVKGYTINRPWRNFAIENVCL